MSNFEKGSSTEKISPEQAVSRLESIISNGTAMAILDRAANKRGWSMDILKNTLEMFVEDYPTNERLPQLLAVLENPGNDNEAYEEKVEELLDLVA